MTRTDPAPGALSMEFDLHHSPKKVWRALTDPTLLAKWLLPVTGLRLEPSAAFTFTASPQPGWDGHVNCRVLAATAPSGDDPESPPATLSFTWVVGDLDTVVTFTLTPTASGTRLSLVHTGFKPGQERNFAGARYGWKMMTDRLFPLLDEVSA